MVAAQPKATRRIIRIFLNSKFLIFKKFNSSFAPTGVKGMLMCVRSVQVCLEHSILIFLVREHSESNYIE